MGWPGSRAKVEFNSWQNSGTELTHTKNEKMASKASLERVILPRFQLAFGGSKFHTKRLPEKRAAFAAISSIQPPIGNAFARLDLRLFTYIVLRYTREVHWIGARYNRRHEEAYLVGLSGAG